MDGIIGWTRLGKKMRVPQNALIDVFLSCQLRFMSLIFCITDVAYFSMNVWTTTI